MADDLSTAQAGVENAEQTNTAADDNAEAAEIVSPDTDATGSEGEDGQEQPQEEEIEFDFGGNKFRAPKSAIPENIAVELDKFAKGTWSDYTRKSQAIAEQTKSLEARSKAVEKLSGLNDETLTTFSRGLSVRQELEQLSKIDLRALWQSNPDQARQVSDAISAKQAELQGIVTRVSQLEGEMSTAQAAEVARRMDEGRQIVEKRIPGFAAKHLPDVIEYVATNYGISKDVAARDWPLNPDTAQMAYKAMLYDRMQAQASKAAKRPAPQQAAPVTPIKGKGGPAQKGVKDMSVSEMAKHLGIA